MARSLGRNLERNFLGCYPRIDLEIVQTLARNRRDSNRMNDLENAPNLEKSLGWYQTSDLLIDQNSGTILEKILDLGTCPNLGEMTNDLGQRRMRRKKIES